MGSALGRFIATAIAFWVADYLLAGISFGSEGIMPVLIVALIFGVVNALVKPIVSLLSLPVTILTLGLFTFVINAAMLGLTAWLAGDLFNVDGFVSALLGSLIISIVGSVVGGLLGDGRDDRD